MKIPAFRSIVAAIGLLLMQQHSFSQTINFSGLNPGEILGTQFASQGITFLPYSTKIQGEVANVNGSRVGLFDLCSGCEFFPSVANIAFNSMHQEVKIDLGVISRGSPVNITREVTAFAYNAAGQIIATNGINVASTTGFSNEMTLTATSAVIVRVQIQSVDPTAATNLGISVITADTPVSNTPDFTLDGNNYFELIAGGAQVSTQFSIRRFGGSSGNINFSAAGLPAGVHAVFPLNPVAGDICALTLLADKSANSGSFSFTVTGTPGSTAAGPAPRSITVNVKVSQAFTLFAPIEVDLDNVPDNGTGRGTISIPLSVLRAGSVAVPATISIDGVPPGVTASFSRSSLTFPGFSTGDNTVLTFTATAGIDVAAIMVIHITNGQVTDDFLMGIFGTVPRVNKNFIIRGSFFADQLGTIRPVEGARVQIYRDVSWALDEEEAEGFTDANGNYEFHIEAGDVNTYYAKIRLADAGGASVQDSWSAHIWSCNSYNRADNTGPVIDLGGTVIQNDNGATTRASIFQGAHFAYQDFMTQVGGQPPYGQYQVIMWESMETPFSLQTESEWPDQYPTSKFGPQTALGDNFHDYLTNFHEFGHTLRHYVDGDKAHFVFDAARFTYGQSHTICDDNNEGFGFNEGWAEFWSKEPLELGNVYPCPKVFPDFGIEMKCAFDLQQLMTCAGVSRKDMFNVLLVSPRIIHSEEEYRGRFQALFPGVDMSKCPPFKEPAPGTPPPPPPPAPLSARIGLDSTAIVNKLNLKIRAESLLADSLHRQIKNAAELAAAVKKDGPGDPKKKAMVVCRPNVLQAQEMGARLLESVFQRELEAVKAGKRVRPAYAEDFKFGADSAASMFDLRSRNIVGELLNKNMETLKPFILGDRSGKIKEMIAAMQMKSRLIPLKTSGSNDWYSMLNVPGASGEYAVSAKRKKK